jgi:hypothetical protein
MIEIFKSNKQEPVKEATVAGGRRWLAGQPAQRGTPLWARAAPARKLRRQRESEEAREPSNPMRVLNLRGDDVEEEARPRGSLPPLTNPITKKERDEKEMETGEGTRWKRRWRLERKKGGAAQQPGVCEGER